MALPLEAIWAFCSPVPTDVADLVGLYFLVDDVDHEIAYIGQSTDICRRIDQHRRQSRRAGWKWHRAIWMRLPVLELDDFEGALIRELRPRYNTTSPRSPGRAAGRDRAILAAFGLAEGR